MPCKPQQLKDVCQINPRFDRNRLGLQDNTEVSFVPMEAVNEMYGVIDSKSDRQYREVKQGYTAFLNSDVLFAKITPCMENGKIALAADLTNGVGFGSTEFHVLRAHDNILPMYLYYFVKREAFRRLAKQQMIGAVGQQRVPKRFLENVSISVPPLKEQKRIVDILDRTENIIRLRQLAIETTQQIASALFYEMFGNPIRNEKGWEVKEIGETCEQNRITYNNERDGQLTYLGLEHITNNTGDIVELSEEGVKGKAATFVFDETHVLYGKLRPYLNKVVMPTFRGRCTTELIPYLPKPNIGRCYLTYLLRSETIVNTVVSNSTGTRMPRANLKHLESIKVGVPPYEIHKKFEGKVASMYEFLKRQRTSQETSHELYSSLRAQILAA